MAATRRTTRTRPLNDENAAVPAVRASGKAVLGSVSAAPKAALSSKPPSLANKTLGVRKRAALGELTTNATNTLPEAPAEKNVVEKPSRAALGAGIRTRSSTNLAAQASATATVDAPRPALRKPPSSLGVGGALSTKTNIPRRTAIVPGAKPNSRKGRSAGPPKVKADEGEEEEVQPKAKRARTSEPALDVALEPPAKDEGWEDLDIGDESDPLMVTTYVSEVYTYLKELEVRTLPDANYMDRQGEITWTMRRILIDWLVDVHTRFRLLPETIFLAAHIVDRFLSIRVVSLVKFQLVGVTALFIAAKYEEVVCPSVQNFLFMTDGGYEEEEILKAERYVLQMIGFDLSYPNPIHFLRRISKADGYDIQTRTIAKYFLEMTILDNAFLPIVPSMMAAAATWLARKVLGRGSAWDANLVHYSTYSEEELLPTAQLMLDYVVRQVRLSEPESPNFTKKYAAKKYYRASEYVKNWAETRYKPKSLPGRADVPVRLEEWSRHSSSA